MPRIDPYTLSKIPVPIVSEELMNRVDTLIKDSTLLRDKSIKSLREAHEIFNQVLDLTQDQKLFNKYNSSRVLANFHKRLDSSFYLNIEEPEKELIKSKYNSIPLGELVLKKMFNAQRGRRNYVKKGGIQFLSTSNISEKNPLLIDKFLSRKTDGLETLIVKKNWILISSSGQDILGSCYIVNECYDDCAVNQHSVRVIIDDEKISPLYVFGFLSNPKTKKYIRAGIYGSAVLTINEDFLKHLLIPILSDELDINRIVHLVAKHVEYHEKACYKEKEAIDLIENVIESWQ